LQPDQAKGKSLADTIEAGQLMAVASTANCVGERLELKRLLQLIPSLIDQNPSVHWRSPMDMIFQGRSTSVFQA
jgi:hypothetical protein